MIMATKIRHQQVFGNFRPPLRERAKPKLSAQQRREGNCEEHRRLIKMLPCCVTGKAAPNDGHHLKSGPAKGERALGRRATDRWLVPLCRQAHDELERISSRLELSWFRERGIDDPVELAAALWANTGDLERMTRIVQAHMGRPPR